jgi:hypothetical protein
MAEQHEQSGQENARRAAEASRRAAQQRAREGLDETRRTADAFATIGTETLTVWIDTQQRVARDVLQLTSEAVQESTRVISDLQQTTLDAMQEMQTMSWRWFALWPDAVRDPFRWYERAVGEAMENGRRSLRMGRSGVDAVTRSMERMQDTAGQTASTMEETFRQAAGRLQEVASKAERLRAA